MNLNYLSLLDTDALKQVIANFDRHAIHHPQTARLSQQSWMPLSVWRLALSTACLRAFPSGAGLHAVSAPGAVCL
ncbi:hypothetical protein FA041_02585 [Escherichia coli]|nr:hypothetical protein [Escherichia coli]